MGPPSEKGRVRGRPKDRSVARADRACQECPRVWTDTNPRGVITPGRRRAQASRRARAASLAIPRDRLVVLVERGREVVVAVIDGDEIEIRDGGRRQDGLHRRLARAPDGTWWEAPVAIGVE